MELHMAKRLTLLLLALGCAHALAATSARAQAAPRVFALIVANNRSVNVAQPDLQYADDDGARYYRLFRSVAEAGHVELLTSFDRASAGQFSSLAQLAHAPTRRALLEARDRMLAELTKARANGEQTVFYFVYAGHGEVLDGRGVIDLEDSQIDGEFLERELLERLPAAAKHVVLDSCNSFFVVNPRKPGGRRWATPKDMAFGFSARHPEVGLFLSTNSESEVYEWSELESGVFSHEVRSGLSGAADVDGDGRITYVELAGFIESANAGIGREALRPHVFFRGPRGDREAALFTTQQMRGRRVLLGAEQTRLWIKSASGERLLDVHKEAMPMTLVLPDGEEGELALYFQRNALGERVSVMERTAPAGAEPVAVALLEESAPRLAARGSRLFGQLFSSAYGPVAHAAYLQQSGATAEPVFGLTQSDLTRSHNYLAEFAAEGRARRRFLGLWNLGLGAIAGSVAIALAVQPDRGEFLTPIAGTALLSGALIATGLTLSLRPSSGEQALTSFERELGRRSSSGARAFVQTEAWLTRIAERERRQRVLSFWAYEAAAVSLAVAASVVVASPAHGADERRDRAVSSALLFSEAAVFSVLGAALRSGQTPSERLLKLYQQEPGPKLQLGGAVGPSSFSLGLSGKF
jgi:hypothetical protein